MERGEPCECETNECFERNRKGAFWQWLDQRGGGIQKAPATEAGSSRIGPSASALASWHRDWELHWGLAWDLIEAALVWLIRGAETASLCGLLMGFTDACWYVMCHERKRVG